MSIRFLIALAAAAALTALGVSSGGARASANNICVAALAPATLVYPSKGATNVPDGNFALVLSHAVPTISLAIDGVVAIPSLQAVTPNPSASPSEGASPSAASAASSTLPLKASYMVPKLQPHTTYQVLAALPISGCYDPNHPPAPKIGTVGSFTTQ